jgi:hypothetical protein
MILSTLQRKLPFRNKLLVSLRCLNPQKIASSKPSDIEQMTIKTSINSSIKMCFWNTGGLKSKNNDKTSDPIFLKEDNSKTVLVRYG